MKKVSLAILSILFLLIGCNAEEDSQADQQESENDTLQIYSTLYPLAYFTEEIGGEFVEVETILPPGSDPHNFEPTSKMMVDIAEADMFLYNGANLETYAGKIEEALVGEDVLMVEAAEGVSLVEHVHKHEDEHAHEEEEHSHEDEHAHEEEEHSHEDEHAHEEEEHSHEDEHAHEEEEHSHEDEHAHEEEEHSHEDEHAHEEEEHSHEDEHAHEEEEHSHEDEHAHEEEAEVEVEEEHDHDHGDDDPHLWLDPIRSIELARNIKDALIELNPEQEEIFETNFSDLEDRLIALDDEFHEQLEGATNNEILVTHAAYGYWEQSYGLEQIALAGLSPSEEPSQKELERILDHVEDTNIQYLLFEQNIEPKVAEVIQAETNVESLQLHNLSILTDEDIENDETYFSLMERNLNVLTEALDY
ncbi:adhesin [Gracilibacillus salitolerans]|uniref:Adhesin n=1 Tax=Gracilibacillus salitolerans TaxID=2663022 RepID=A0A5Q2TKL1_9BACI|nr:zinc ABC transporter substrate-binding protein [Gracilibacillus salitolerans]QGH35494.1 adhesin [Gracilibacillus salitolerans]